MWYVVQVATGNEDTVKELCTRQISSAILEECFIPHYEEMKRYRGSWHKNQSILFPGYVFVVTEHIEQLGQELRSINGLTKILGSEGTYIPLSPSEIAFLERFGGPKRVVDVSVGFIENDRVQITEGPLMGMEGCITHIDRHKRKARLNVEMFGRQTEVTVGIEIVMKKTTQT